MHLCQRVDNLQRELEKATEERHHKQHLQNNSHQYVNNLQSEAEKETEENNSSVKYYHKLQEVFYCNNLKMHLKESRKKIKCL